MILDTFPAAPADTLLGRLQRGTGAGFLEALAAKEDVARAALEGAIRLDWRWDQQLESRSWYYACLAERLGISSADVERLILSTVDHDPQDSVDRVAVHVLSQLASWGDDAAAERLIDYVRYGGSPDIPVSWCGGEGTAADLDRHHAALGARFPNRAAVARDTANLPAWSLSYLEFWLESLAKRDNRFLRIVRLLDSAKASRTTRNDESPPPPAEPFPADMTFEEGCRKFLSASWHDGPGIGAATRWRREALAWLGGRFRPSHADRLVDLLLAEHPDSSLACLSDLATLLPPEEWPDFMRRALADGREGPRWAVRGLLERSERPDAELVQRCLRSALAANDIYPACDMLDLVKRARLVELVPDVERAYHEATYSYGARLRAVEALVRLTPELYRERYARECLWDCEEFIIEIGCRHVELDDLDVRPRLEFLRDAFESDADEEPEGIHNLARERLGY